MGDKEINLFFFLKCLPKLRRHKEIPPFKASVHCPLHSLTDLERVKTCLHLNFKTFKTKQEVRRKRDKEKDIFLITILPSCIYVPITTLQNPGKRIYWSITSSVLIE